MTNGFVEQIKKYAREDAKRGIYMSKGCIQMGKAQMKKYVSPDRSGPKAEVMSAIQAALKEPPMLQALEIMLEKLSGDCSASEEMPQYLNHYFQRWGITAGGLPALESIEFSEDIGETFSRKQVSDGTISQAEYVEILEKPFVVFDRLFWGVLRSPLSPDAVSGAAGKCRKHE